MKYIAYRVSFDIQLLLLLAVGEQYFGPLVSYARTAASERGPAPGALTYGERLHHSWAAGQRQSQHRYNLVM